MRPNLSLFAASVVTLGLTVVGRAEAGNAPPPGSCGYEEEEVWYPARYVGTNPGDVVLLHTGADSIASALMSSVGLKYVHTTMMTDTLGLMNTDSNWDGVAPPNAQSTGSPNPCSRVLNPTDLQNLPPGTAGQSSYIPSNVVAGSTIVPAFGHYKSGQTVAMDTYHFNSFFHSDTKGGSCEKYLVDFWGVPVVEADKFVLSGSLLNQGLQNIYHQTYKEAIGQTTGLPWYDYAFCGGVDSTILAQRATNQVINEIRWKWKDMYLPNGETSDTIAQDTAAEGTTVGGVYENLGGAGQNDQWGGGNDYCMNVNESNQGVGTDCPSWQGRISTETDAKLPLVMNVPDNIAAAAKRLGVATKVATVTPGYYAETLVYVCTPE
jgi:hypothetical protein